MNNVIVDFCDHKAAKHAVTHWHYSKSMPTPPVVKIGVWEDTRFIGVVLFSRGANMNLGKSYGLKKTQVCELTRVALTNHTAYTSQIVRIAIRLMNSKNNLRLIYSYADTNENHHGGIYQAMNWIYTGMTPKNYKYQDGSGRIWHQRQVSKTGVKPQYGELRTVPKISDCTKIPQLGKHRYLYPLDKSMRRKIIKFSVPYPKQNTPLVNGDNLATR